jgi:hypothetical protein
MVVPSNDFFIGNDSPMRYPLFDAAGNLMISSINQTASRSGMPARRYSIPTASAFRRQQRPAYAAEFGGCVQFRGTRRLQRSHDGAGYTLDSTLAADTGVYRISFAVAPVPEPETYAMMLGGLLLVGSIARRRLG